MAGRRGLRPLHRGDYGRWEGEWRAAGVCGPYEGEGGVPLNFSAAF